MAYFDDENYYQCSSARKNYPDDFNGDFGSDSDDPACANSITTVITTNTFVFFSATSPIGAVIVKGSDDANTYVYEPQESSDSGLASPLNAGGQRSALSNLTFCWNPTETEVEAQWCSPGYWRQAHHLGSWEATGISPTALYSAHFGSAPPLTKQGEKSGAPTDPSLWTVLQYPQYYGGDAFNNVGDLLSEAHPDVNFTGDRVEDSCPLGRNPGEPPNGD